MAYRILVIDDEPDLQLLITQRFQKEIDGGELFFEFASDGLEGLKKVDSNNNYHVIVTDLKMPVMDGFELLKSLKERDVLSKALVASAYDDMQNFRLAMNTGAFDFIVKPIAFNDLKVTIYKAIADYNNHIEGLEAKKKLIEAVKEKEAAILKERLRISRDLHDDVGASISGISITASTAIDKVINDNKSEAVHLIQSITTDLSEVITTMSDMVWLINPINDSAEKLFERIQLFAVKVFAPLDVSFIIDDVAPYKNLPLSIEVRKNIFLIIKESINNAAKYSHCTQCKLQITKTQKSLTIICNDNGKGFDAGARFLGNGLKNIKQRATEINAQVMIYSKPIKGTTVQLIVPLSGY